MSCLAEVLDSDGSHGKEHHGFNFHPDHKFNFVGPVFDVAAAFRDDAGASFGQFRFPGDLLTIVSRQGGSLKIFDNDVGVNKIRYHLGTKMAVSKSELWTFAWRKLLLVVVTS